MFPPPGTHTAFNPKSTHCCVYTICPECFSTSRQTGPPRCTTLEQYTPARTGVWEGEGEGREEREGWGFAWQQIYTDVSFTPLMTHNRTHVKWPSHSKCVCVLFPPQSLEDIWYPSVFATATQQSPNSQVFSFVLREGNMIVLCINQRAHAPALGGKFRYRLQPEMRI